MHCRLRSEFSADQGSVTLFFINKSNTSFQSFGTRIENLTQSQLAVETLDLPPVLLPSRSQSQQKLSFTFLQIFNTSPTIHISYLAGALQKLSLRLPVSLCKFLQATQHAASDIIGLDDHWSRFEDTESKDILALPKNLSSVDVGRLRSIVMGCRWGVLHTVSLQHSKEFIANSVLTSRKGLEGPVMLRLNLSDVERNVAIRVRGISFATAESLKNDLMASLRSFLS